MFYSTIMINITTHSTSSAESAHLIPLSHMCCFESSAIKLELKFNSESAQKNDSLVKAWPQSGNDWIVLDGRSALWSGHTCVCVCDPEQIWRVSAIGRSQGWCGRSLALVCVVFRAEAPLLKDKSSAHGITDQPRVIQPYHCPAPASQTLQAVCQRINAISMIHALKASVFI